MAQQSRSSQPTIRQDLQRSPALNPGIRASGLYSYTEARPSYIDRDRFASKGRNTPFHGFSVRGRVKYTISEGNVIYQEQEE